MAIVYAIALLPSLVRLSVVIIVVVGRCLGCALGMLMFSPRASWRRGVLRARHMVAQYGLEAFNYTGGGYLEGRRRAPLFLDRDTDCEVGDDVMAV
jgi:hypothetical protein